MAVIERINSIEVKMIVAILQARMSSTRLPGKVLRPLLAEPMLYRQIERIRRCTKINQLVVATSDQPEDDAIVKFCAGVDIPIYRGQLNDVLDRYYQTAITFGAEQIVRLTADCPLTDPDLIDGLVTFHQKGNFAYSSNAIERTYPDGLDAEIFSMLTLKTAWQEAASAMQREHVTAFIYNNPQRFSLGLYKSNLDLSQLRWTVDYIEDFELITQIYTALYPSKPNFTTQDIMQLLDQRPELSKINHLHVAS